MKKCEVCETEFKPARATGKYCSEKCRKAAQRGAKVSKSTGLKPPKSGELKNEPIIAPSFGGAAQRPLPPDTAIVHEVDSDTDVTVKPSNAQAIGVSVEEYTASEAKRLGISVDEYHKRLAAFNKMGLNTVDWITTGIPEFDELTQIPRGRVTQIQGPYAVGKTTLCLNMIKGLSGKAKVLYIDTEAALNPQLLMRLGLDPKTFTLYNESAFIEDIYEVIIGAVEHAKYDMIVLDSLASTTFRTEAAGEAANANIGQKAKIVGKLMRIIPMELKRTNTALVIINQEREVIGSYAPVKYTPGGMGVPYAASLMVSLKTTKGARFPKSGPPFKGHTVTAEIIKSKVNEPWRKAEFKLYYGAQ